MSLYKPLFLLKIENLSAISYLLIFFKKISFLVIFYFRNSYQ